MTLRVGVTSSVIFGSSGPLPPNELDLWVVAVTVTVWRRLNERGYVSGADEVGLAVTSDPALQRQADWGTRTPDPLLTMEVLYQLS